MLKRNEVDLCDYEYFLCVDGRHWLGLAGRAQIGLLVDNQYAQQ
jgi:hypothetical protein